MADASQSVNIEHLISHLRKSDPRLYEALVAMSRGLGVRIPVSCVSGVDELITGLELPLTTKGDLLTRDAQGLVRRGIENTREGYVPTIDVRSEVGWGWKAPLASPTGALTIDILKAAVLIGACDELNFTEDGNVALTISIAGKRVTVGVQAIPGSSIPPYSSLWAWNGINLTQFAIAYTGGGGPWTVANVTLYENTDTSSGDPLHDHIPHFKFFNPVGTAANVFFLYSSSSIIAAAGELLYVEIDYYNAATNTTGIIIAKPGSETTDNYRLLDNNTTLQLYKAVAGVGEVLQADAVTIYGYTGHGWHRIRLVVNTSAGAIGGIPAGGMNVYNGSIPVYKKTMKVTGATVLSGAVTIGVRFLGNAGLGNVYGRVSRLSAYSVGADFEQFF